MPTKQITVDRFSVVSAKSFEEVLAGLDKGIGRPNMRVLHEQMAAASSFSEFQKVIHGAVGSADLLEFLRLDLGAATQKDPQARAYKIVRIIAGNPLIMKQMTEHVPDAGSYAPVTILVYESHEWSPSVLRHDGELSGILQEPRGSRRGPGLGCQGHETAYGSRRLNREVRDDHRNQFRADRT